MAAICGRCVTQMTCLRLAMCESFSATRWAATPEIPSSISSNTSVSGPERSLSASFITSIILASSPPDAILDMRPGSSPAFALIRKRTVSPPVESNPGLPPSGLISTSKRTFGMLSSRSPDCTRSFKLFAASTRLCVSVCEALYADFSLFASSKASSSRASAEFFSVSYSSRALSSFSTSPSSSHW